MCSIACLVALMSMTRSPEFLAAKPIWPEGRETERNLFVGFRGVIDRPAEGPVVLRTAGWTVYRVFVNGAFRGYGSARGPHGWYRMDEWDISDQLTPGRNVIAIEVAGYNANSYYLIDEPSFLQAEVVANGKVLAATGAEKAPFDAILLKQRVEKVERYSFQRPFSEVYRMTPDSDRWRSAADAPVETIRCAPTEAKRLLARRVPYPRFDVVPASWRVASGTVEQNAKVDHLWKDRSLTDIGPKLGGYPEKELALVQSNELQHVKNVQMTKHEAAKMPKSLPIAKDAFEILDLGRNITGFPRMQVHCDTPSRLYVLFDEMLREEDVDWRRLGCVNAVLYELQPGDYTLESFEPYTARYLKLVVLDGACAVTDIGLRLYENAEAGRAEFKCGDPRINRLFEAGRATFAQNAVDVFTDCPHRERAGWLCDSFFTARSAVALTGRTNVERNFMENFLLPETFKALPDGMLPMCYPADHNDGVFIPNWAMWFVMQLGEYADRSGDRDTVDALKPRVLALFDYFKKFKNSDGLLEKLDKWVFVEWSKANDWVQDVNYPSSMLYAGALSAAARLYGMPELAVEADAMRATILKQSFDGAFFVDNAKRNGDHLEVTKNHSEVCQYFAFYFGVATPETHPELWRVLRDEFGPKRKENKGYPEVAAANSFIGNMLRMELLSRYGNCAQILDESIDYLYYMAERTDTLWENTGDFASLNHGFASHIVYTLQRDVLGAYAIDPVAKTVKLRFTPLKLERCEGRIPVGDEFIVLSWKQDSGAFKYRITTPDGYRVEVDNKTGKKLVKE